MKQDYGMFFFACLLVQLMPDHRGSRLCPLADPLKCCSQIVNWSDIQSCVRKRKKNNIQSVIIDPYCTHHTTGHVHNGFVSVPADFVYFPAWTGFSIITMKWCWQCTSLFFHHLLQLLMVCILRVYIAQKNERGEKTVCAIKIPKSSFTPAIGTHPHITSMIYINS